MTEDLTTFAPEDRVNSVLEKMNEFSFDVGPIEISGHIRKYVRRKDLQDVSKTDRIIDHAVTLEEDDFLGTDVPVIDPSPGSQDLLTILDERQKRFAFIVRDGVAGIVTHADLNKIQSGVPLYQLVSEFEEAACDLIDEEIEHSRWVSHLDDDEKGDVEKVYQKAKDENADLRLVDCLNTRQINEILKEYDLLHHLECGEERVESILEEVADLRNDVMHQRPMVGEHSFGEFVEIVEELKQVNQALR